jgi:hypothetical protein
MRDLSLLLFACLAAALAPALPRSAEPDPAPPFPGWPASFEGRPLTAVPLAERDRRFAERFPGRVQTFSDGRRTLILRFVHRPTRRLHPASDCFRGAGWEVRPLPVLDAGNGRWGRFEAIRAGERLRISERIEGTRDGSWTDVSSWFWSASFDERTGPWWATTLIERVG